MTVKELVLVQVITPSFSGEGLYIIKTSDSRILSPDVDSGSPITVNVKEPDYSDCFYITENGDGFVFRSVETELYVYDGRFDNVSMSSRGSTYKINMSDGVLIYIEGILDDYYWIIENENSINTSSRQEGEVFYIYRVVN